MTINQEMLRTAEKAGRLLGEVPAAETARFYLGLLRPDGGFADRAGRSDLYYSMFGLQACVALGAALPIPAVKAYLESFVDGGRLDSVHLSCLARCWAVLGGETCPPAVSSTVLERIEACRSKDGGYAQQPGQAAGSAYGCFLALGAYQDIGVAMPNPAGVEQCLAKLSIGDGSCANDAAMPIGSTPATAAAVMVLAHLGRPANPGAADWLLDQHDPAGGFRVMEIAPEPDLLSTAVTLLALNKLQADISPIRPACLEFVHSLHTEGQFAGHPGDETPDAEYTFYGLLALGCLAR